MDEALHALMLADAAIAAVVGGRVYWGLALQGSAKTYVTLHIIGAQDHAHMQGAGGLLTYRVQINSYGPDRPSAAEIAATIRSRLNGTQNGQLRLIRFDTERDAYSDTASGGVFWILQDYIVTWRPDHG